MTGGTSGQALLYVSFYRGRVYILTYPDGKRVRRFDPLDFVFGLCADSSGHVFVDGDKGGEGYIVEYTRGSTIPTRTLVTGANYPASCAADATTGNLAFVVRNQQTGSYRVGIYRHARGNPTYYMVSGIYPLLGCAYDDHGNLFVGGGRRDAANKLAELSSGGQSFSDLTLNRRITVPVALQWVSPYLTIAENEHVYRAKISGSTARIVGHTQAVGGKPEAWIEGNTLIEVHGKSHQAVGFWSYPEGGNPFKVIRNFKPGFLHLTAVVVSAPISPNPTRLP